MRFRLRFSACVVMIALSCVWLSACGRGNDEPSDSDAEFDFGKRLEARFAHVVTAECGNSGTFALTPSEAWGSAESAGTISNFRFEAKAIKSRIRLTLSVDGTVPSQADLLLHYDPDRYRQLEFNWDNEFTATHLALSVNSLRGSVPVTWTRLNASNVSSTVFTAWFELGMEPESRSLSDLPPQSPSHLSGYPNGVDHYLTWTQHNPGDYNRDGAVNGLDLFSLGAHFGEMAPSGGPGLYPRGNECYDGNADGRVNGGDVFLIANNFKKEISAHRVYKWNSATNGFRLAAELPVVRSFEGLCTLAGSYLDAKDYFLETLYYVTALDDEGNESEPSEILQQVDASDLIGTYSLGSQPGRALTDTGFTLTVPGGVLADDEEINIYCKSYDSGPSGRDPIIGRVYGLTRENRDMYSEPLKVTLPVLASDRQGLAANEIGLAFTYRSTGSWTPIHPSEFDVEETQEGSVLLTYELDSFADNRNEVHFVAYDAGPLRVNIRISPTEARAGQTVKLSCRPAGGPWPSHRIEWHDRGVYSHLFSNAYNGGIPINSEDSQHYEVRCQVEDAFGNTAVSETVDVYVRGSSWSGNEIGAPGLTRHSGIVERADGALTIAWDQNGEDGTIRLAELEEAVWSSRTIHQLPPNVTVDEVRLNSSEMIGLLYRDGDPGYWRYGSFDGDWQTLSIPVESHLDQCAALVLADTGEASVFFTDQKGDNLWKTTIEGDNGETELVVSMENIWTAPGGADYRPDGVAAVAFTAAVENSSALHYYSGQGVSEVPYSPNVAYSLKLKHNLIGYPHIVHGSAAYDRLYDSFWDGDSWDYDLITSREMIAGGLDFDRENQPFVPFHSQDTEQMVLSWLPDSYWRSTELETAEGLVTQPEVTIDSDNNPVVSYYHKTQGRLRVHRQSAEPFVEDTTPPIWTDTVGAASVEAYGTRYILRWNRAEDAEHDPVRYQILIDDESPMDFENPKYTYWIEDPYADTGGYDYYRLYSLGDLGDTWHFAVRAWDSYSVANCDNNKVEVSATATADTQPPTWLTTVGIQKMEMEFSRLRVYWNKAEDESMSVSYQAFVDTQTPVRISSGATIIGVNGSAPEDSEYLHSDLIDLDGFVEGQTYYCLIRARDTYGNSDDNTVEMSVVYEEHPPDTTPPQWTGAEGLQAVQPFDRRLVFYWGEVLDDTTENLEYYLYYSGNPEIPKSDRQTAHRWMEHTLTPSPLFSNAIEVSSQLNQGTTWYGRVRVNDAAGNLDSNDVVLSATVPSWKEESVFEEGIAEISLAIDTAGRPALAVVDESLPGLRLARLPEESWSISEVESGVFNSCGLAFESGGEALIASYRHDQENSMNYLYVARGQGVAWSSEDLAQVGDVAADGSRVSVAADDDGRSFVAYHDSAASALMLARWEGGSWNLETVTNAGDAGYWASLALGPGGAPAIAFNFAVPEDLGFASWSGSAWEIETVDASGSVGTHCALAFDPLGNPGIAYRDEGFGNLRLARRLDGEWSFEEISTVQDTGYYPSLDFDVAGLPHLTYVERTRDLGWYTEIYSDGEIRTGSLGYYGDPVRRSAIRFDGNLYKTLVYLNLDNSVLCRRLSAVN